MIEHSARLPYAYDALEPYISKQIMTLHHTKHHQTYVNALNSRREVYAAASTPKERISLQAALKFNGGGHINHSLFWKNLPPSPDKGATAACSSTAAQGGDPRVVRQPRRLKKEFNAATLGIQGSGWGWLGVNPSTKRLEIATTPNQDPLLTLVPLLGVDIWEHAFYLQYLNVKPDYLNAIWSVITLTRPEKRYLEVAKL
ncbi:manganese superoxide dismutase [Mycena latifolia]|nr:manganese superoxide dismutase [Mycena latifolia]